MVKSKKSFAIEKPDVARQNLLALIERDKTDLATVSKKAGKNHAYLQQFINYGTPAVLPEEVRTRLGVHFNVPAEVFKNLPLAEVKAQVIQPRGNNLLFQELDVRAGAGNQQLVENDDQPQVGTWSIPRQSIESHVKDASSIRIIQVVGDSMMPELYPGDRIMVNLADRIPSPPGLFVVWDGLGLVVKRCQIIQNSKPPRIKLSSANKEYDPYELALEECHINGRVIGRWQWT